MKKIILISLLVLANLVSYAQADDNPIKELSQRLLQNEMLSQRFFRDYVFIKTNNFKKKALLDMDKSLARFDDNMNYFSSHLPQDPDVREDYEKLQGFWNVYRLRITDYDKNQYGKLIAYTKKFDELMNRFLSDMIEEHKDYSRHKKTINIAILDAENIKAIDNTASTYILKNFLEMSEDDLFSIDFDEIKKRLKKIGKFKPVAQQTHEYITDLYQTLNAIEKNYYKEDYNPKMMFSFVSAFSKKSYKILDIIINQI